MKADTVILDCYTDEPSGYGVRPFLGTHQLHLSQVLALMGIPHVYLTIDDLRFASAEGRGDIQGPDTDISTVNRTVNCRDALQIIRDARTIYVIMGCFVEYKYFSSKPPKSDEVYGFLASVPAKIVLFYVLGTSLGVGPDFASSRLSNTVAAVEHGNAYRYAWLGHGSTAGMDLSDPDYDLLAKIGRVPPPLLSQLSRPIIAEIETGTGCNTPTCTYCIECLRRRRVVYRQPADVVAHMSCLYQQGVRHFRLGRQPNFFHFGHHDAGAVERLLSGIREACPDLRVLHIDNANAGSVVTSAGRRIARLVARYCTSGNVAPLGIESFDPHVRTATNISGSVDEVFEAIRVLNEAGAERGEDGLPRLLPGINLIDGLPGESQSTHPTNVSALERIYNSGLMTYRLFFRTLTPPTGTSLTPSVVPMREGYGVRHSEIVDRFVLPMQSRVYPIGTVISGDWEAIQVEGMPMMRTVGTCSIRVQADRFLGNGPLGARVEVTENIGNRLLAGRIVSSD